MLRDLTRGVKTVDVDCETVGEAIERLEELYPGVRARLCEEDRLRPSLVIFVDGVAQRQNLRWRLTPASEVQFVPVIAGGMGSQAP